MSLRISIVVLFAATPTVDPAAVSAGAAAGQPAPTFTPADRS